MSWWHNGQADENATTFVYRPSGSVTVQYNMVLDKGRPVANKIASGVTAAKYFRLIVVSTGSSTVDHWIIWEHVTCTATS